MEVKPGLRRRRGIARWTRSMAFNTSGRWDLQFRLAGIYLTRNWCWARVKLDLVNCAWLISRPCKGSLFENILFACSEAWKKAVIFHNLWSKFCCNKKIKARPKDGKVFKERRDSNWWDDRRMVGRRLNAPHSHPPSHARPIHVPPSHRPIAPLRSALPGRFFLQETNRPSIFLEDNQKKFCEHQVLGEWSGQYE